MVVKASNRLNRWMLVLCWIYTVIYGFAAIYLFYRQSRLILAFRRDRSGAYREYEG
ncbi:hypothetical protein QJS35_06125 [Cohnella silvisoli]|uniref:Uncharacterized protein n=1 Tax=Cohnella silvisoli TaxID=2873699 RepID=A0ABV1KPL7_9BACL